MEMVQAVFSVEIKNGVLGLPRVEDLFEFVDGKVRDGCGYSCLGYTPQTGRCLVLVDSSASKLTAMKASYTWLGDLGILEQRRKWGYCQPYQQHFRVSSLADSGKGTLREALEADGSRLVTFDVTGTIRLKSPIVVKPHVMVSGATAPAGGICVADAFLVVAVEDVIFQHLRLRPGDTMRQENDGLMINYPARNIIIDHCSISWAIDECIHIWGAPGQLIEDVIIQWCIISEGLSNSYHSSGQPHSCGLIAGYANNVSLHHNLIAFHNTRYPLASGRVDVINNVLCGWGEQCMLFRYREAENTPTRINNIGNYYKKTSYSNLSLGEVLIMDYGTPDAPMEIYSASNKHTRTIKDEWDLHRLHFSTVGTVEQFRKKQPFPLVYPAAIEPAESAYTNVLANAGATLPKRDTVDSRIVSQVENNIGTIIDSQADVGGWPDLSI